jgi:Fe-S oxidoreductase
MNSLINAEMVERIRATGNPAADLPDRIKIMETLGLPFDRRAENVVIMGCQNLKLMPETIKKFARILNRGGMDYTFLSREYCCGNYLYRPAIKAKDEAAMTECRSFSKEFAGMNIASAKKLGARRLILLCSPCYPIYKFAYPEENIVFYPQSIAEVIGNQAWPGKIDYYAGCYKLHRNLAKVPMDLQSTDTVFEKIDGLSLNWISAPACCFKPEGLAYMIDQVKTDFMVHICTGCYFQAMMNMPKDRKVRIVMLPEFIDMVQGG